MDERLRALERAAAAGGEQDRARWLAERVRTGELPAARLVLAAHTGDPAARAALGPEAPAHLELADVWRAAGAEEQHAGRRARVAERRYVRGWCAELATFGVEPLVRAAYAAARRVEGHLRPEDQEARRALEAVAAQLSGEETDLEVCVAAADAAELAGGGPAHDPAAFATRAAAAAAYTAGCPYPDVKIDNLVTTLRLASAALGPASAPTGEPPAEASTFRAPIQAAVRDALSAWALGRA